MRVLVEISGAPAHRVDPEALKSEIVRVCRELGIDSSCVDVDQVDEQQLLVWPDALDAGPWGDW